MVVLVLLGSTFVGLRIQHVRERLKRQKHALGAALQRINHLATHDDLTGLVNRRRMTELLTVERERCERSGRPLVLALLDLDLFKRINDQHGHAVGDAALPGEQVGMGDIEHVVARYADPAGLRQIRRRFRCIGLVV